MNEIVKNIDRNLDISNQETVDGYVEAVSNAVAALKLKEHTVSFIVDRENILEYELEYGSEISIIPDDPIKQGYTFTGWFPDIPQTMPAKDMSFFAVFEKIQEPAITPSVSIKNYTNVRTVDYKTTITFSALTDSIPEGARVVWYKDGQKVATGEKFTAKEVTETFMLKAKITDKSGNTLNSSETELVKVRTDFFSKIIAFFRMIFGRLPIVEQ